MALLRAPDDTLRLGLLYRDGFGGEGTVLFTRGTDGAVNGFTVTVARARDVAFRRIGP